MPSLWDADKWQIHKITPLKNGGRFTLNLGKHKLSSLYVSGDKLGENMPYRRRTIIIRNCNKFDKLTI
jgi:hypothetical protein